MGTLDIQIGGDHYKKLKMQPWELIERTGANFWQGCVVEYITRHEDKNGKEDLLKARHCLSYMQERNIMPGSGWDRKDLLLYIDEDGLGAFEAEVLFATYMGLWREGCAYLDKLIELKYGEARETAGDKYLVPPSAIEAEWQQLCARHPNCAGCEYWHLHGNHCLIAFTEQYMADHVKTIINK